MNTPIYKISGQERKQLKKRLAQLKSLVKSFWYYHQLDKDMASFYSGKAALSNDRGYPMSDEQAKKILASKELEINIIQEQLKSKQ